jgi:hypothetical protein
MMKFYLLPFLSFTVHILLAQGVKSKITILDQQKTPVYGASAILVNTRDTTKMQYRLTDSAGQAFFNLSTNQTYKLKVTYIGFKPLQELLDPGSKSQKYTFNLQEDNQLLGGVTITARKPLMRQEEDMTVVEPEIIAASSTNAYEMMEKIPGLYIDNDGNVYLNGSQPSAIYINGREQKMSPADISTILKNLPPSSILKIELIRNGSAKYDASSTGGIVNIVLRKGVKIGRTGSFTAGANQGRYGAYYAGLNINNNEGNHTSYVNASVSSRNYFEDLLTIRTLATGSKINQFAHSLFPNHGGFISYGIGREYKHDIDFNYDSRYNYNTGTTTSDNQNNIQEGVSILNQSINNVSNKVHNFGLSQEFTLKKKLDTLGSYLSTDLSYTYNRRTNDQFFLITQSLPVLNENQGEGDFGTDRHAFEAKVDYMKKLPGHISFESGLKSGVQFFKNLTEFYDLLNGASSLNTGRSNKYSYHDAIHAAYIQGTKTLGPFVFKAGVRLENTNMTGHQLLSSDTSFSIHRTDLFPYVYLSRRLMKISSYELRAYLISRRSITRPSYEYLNPSIRYIDQFLYETGNPSLRPQFTQTYEANISAADMPVFAIGRNYISDIFTNVVYQDSRDPRVSSRTYDNLGKNKETYFRILGAIPPGGKYFFVVSAQFNMNDYSGVYEGADLTFKKSSWSLFSFHQLKLDSRSTVQAGGFIRLGGQQQFYELGNFGNVFMSVNRYFLDRKLQITLNANDLFYTNRNTFTLNQGSIHAEGNRKSDTRRVGFNLRYNIGFKKKEDGQNPFNLDLENSK